MSNVIIRSFRPGDRNAVCTICCDSADKGEPIERTLADREWAADLLTKYYTDYEPSSTFVAEDNGKVVGYILGCFDNRRYGLVMLFIIIPWLLVKGLTRGVFFTSQFWGVVAAGVHNWRRLFHWRKTSFHSHQAHLHVGIAKGHRGHHVGRQLVETLVSYAKTKGVHELTASVHDSNQAACRFFEHAGFKVQDSHPMIMRRGDALERYTALLYVKKIF